MSKSPKSRLDQLLVERGLAESRTRAQALIMAGLVTSETKRLDKPGHQVAVDIPLSIKGPDHPWVSRGGLKLAHGLDYFSIDTAVLGLSHFLPNMVGRGVLWMYTPISKPQHAPHYRGCPQIDILTVNHMTADLVGSERVRRHFHHRH